MPGRRKIRCELADEIGQEDTCFDISDGEGPFLSGDGPEDLLCGRCDRTILLGLSRQDACTKLVTDHGANRHLAGTAAALRPFPLVVECDCGAQNRLWPIVPR